MGLLEPARRSLPLRGPRRAISALPKLDDLDVAGRRVLLRADLNVPLDAGRITDDFRIRAFLPTLERVLERGGTAVVCSHLGRPKGPDPAFTLAPVATALSAALAGDVPLVDDYATVPDVRVALLENLRFHAGETKNDAGFAASLSAIGDVYVNDAFGACHRAHASIVGPPAAVPSAAGLLLQREIDNLSTLLGDPKRPYVVILGGAKVADKIGIVRNLLGTADHIVIGGGMCFTFLKARGHDIGRSLLDEGSLDEVTSLLRDNPDRIVLPADVVVASGPDADDAKVVAASDIPPDAMGLDVGPESAARFADIVASAGTVFWNGPLGMFEKPAFAEGTFTVAKAVAGTNAYTATGGGDTSAALAAAGYDGKVDFASTGGGASLEFLEGKTLPGIAALTKE